MTKESLSENMEAIKKKYEVRSRLPSGPFAKEFVNLLSFFFLTATFKPIFIVSNDEEVDMIHASGDLFSKSILLRLWSFTVEIQSPNPLSSSSSSSPTWLPTAIASTTSTTWRTRWSEDVTWRLSSSRRSRPTSTTSGCSVDPASSSRADRSASFVLFLIKPLFILTNFDFVFFFL